MTGYDVLVALHVVTVVIGTAGLAVTAGYVVAARVGAAGERPLPAAVARFFGPRPGWAPRLLYPAALFGLAAAGLSHDRVRLALAWVWVAAVLWLGAAAFIEAALLPAERSVSRLLARTPDPGALRACLNRGVVGASGAVALAVAASAVMVVKP